jgi:hypothetical protein
LLALAHGLLAHGLLAHGLYLGNGWQWWHGHGHGHMHITSDSLSITHHTLPPYSSLLKHHLSPTTFLCQYSLLNLLPKLPSTRIKACAISWDWSNIWEAM